MPAGDQAYFLWVAVAVASVMALVVCALSYIRAAGRLHALLTTQYPEHWGIADRSLTFWLAPIQLDNIVEGFRRVDIPDSQFRTLLRAARLRALYCLAAFVVLVLALGMLPRVGR